MNSLKRRQLGSSDISSRNSSTEPSTSQFDERSDKSKPSASNSDADTHTPNSDAETIGSTGTVKANTKTKRAQKQELKEKLKALSKLDPKILPSELEAVHRCIQLTRVPSWMTRVKSVVGFPGSNSLKAAEWLVLYSVYFSLTLIPIWKASSGNPNREALLNSTVELINLTNFLTSRTVDPDDLDWFSKTMINYRTVLAEGWKGQATCKPNLHISQHYPEHITRFGPPASTASWAHERLNGTLGKISTNNRTELEDDDIGKDPYKTFPRLNCKLVYSSLVSSIVIEDNMVVSHAALLTNPPGTFGIFRETCSVVGLASVVSLFLFLCLLYID
ncbi:hypothetical protein PTTG_00406 [Puccinia triticina 1-1 BBBD Race 1]|uniref:Uncharacterized protein n=1 Tax=Puccinia triticina (isolate 1-1 / race 1 (BBBD)) TaxID=630390 RepID=A0A180G895_PUCT1|nr:hypothetical protein PTTG_00406 [Puccinia triticina 1-1 BBBD Race 1]